MSDLQGLANSFDRRYRHDVVKVIGRRRATYRSILIFLIESGGFYCIIWVSATPHAVVERTDPTYRVAARGDPYSPQQQWLARRRPARLRVHRESLTISPTPAAERTNQCLYPMMIIAVVSLGISQQDDIMGTVSHYRTTRGEIRFQSSSRTGPANNEGTNAIAIELHTVSTGTPTEAIPKSV